MNRPSKTRRNWLRAFPDQPCEAVSNGTVFAAVHDQLATLMPLNTAQRHLLFRAYSKRLGATCVEARGHLDAAMEADAFLRAEMRKPPKSQLPFDQLIALKRNGRRLGAAAPSEPGAESPEEYAALCKRAAGPVMPPAIKLAAHIFAATCVAIVELSVLHAVISLRFPPMVGAPEQAISEGPIVAMSAIAVTSGYFAFRDCSPHLEQVLKLAGRVAVLPFMFGMGAFGAGSIFAGLSAADIPPPQTLFDMPQAAGQELIGLLGGLLTGIGDVGFALAILVTPILSFLALENCARGIRENSARLFHAMDYRGKAAAAIRTALTINEAKADATRKLREAQADLEDAPTEIASQIIELSMPYVVAAESLLFQRAVTGGAGADFEPDLLSEQVLAMDSNLLGKRLAAFKAQLDAELIERDLRKPRKASKNSKGA